jgi:hypothetical protein
VYLRLVGNTWAITRKSAWCRNSRALFSPPGQVHPFEAFHDAGNQAMSAQISRLTLVAARRVS